MYTWEIRWKHFQQIVFILLDLQLSITIFYIQVSIIAIKSCRMNHTWSICDRQSHVSAPYCLIQVSVLIACVAAISYRIVISKDCLTTRNKKVWWRFTPYHSRLPVIDDSFGLLKNNNAISYIAIKDNGYKRILWTCKRFNPCTCRWRKTCLSCLE